MEISFDSVDLVWKRRVVKWLSRNHGTYQSLLLQQRCVSIKHKHRSDAEEEQLTNAVKESEEVGILHTVAFAVPHSLHSLVQPYTDVWKCLVTVNT